MNREELIPLNQLCTNYEVEMTFFSSLNDIGLIEIVTVEETPYIHQDEISDLEKIIRMHFDLDINIEGIDTVFNLLQRIDDLQNEVNELRNRLRLYEN